jgi:hypothetical protein
VLGGNNNGPVAGVEAYTPGTNSWTTVASLPVPRAELAGALGADGRIYAIGGYSGGFLTTVAAYTPSANTWTTVADLQMARYYVGAATGADGRIYAIGGSNNAGPLSSVESYGPAFSLVPSVGLPGATVSLSGTNFAPNATVTVGGKSILHWRWRVKRAPLSAFDPV